MSIQRHRATSIDTTEAEYLRSLASKLVELGCKVNQDSGRPIIVVTYSRYPINWCLNHLGWINRKKIALTHTDVYTRSDGSWPLEVMWKGSSIIRIQPGYLKPT